MYTHPSSLNHSLFDQLEKEIRTHWNGWEYLPMKKDLSLYDYANQQIRTNATVQAKQRNVELQSIIREKTKKLFGETIANEVSHQLKTNYSISTTQHHTPFSSKETLNQTLFSSLGYFDKTDMERKYIIVLACAGIPFANAWNPRGYSFHTIKQNEIVELHLPFSGRTLDHQHVLGAKPYTKEALKNMQKRISHFQSEQLIKKKDARKLQEAMQLLFSSQLLEQPSYVDQISIQNYHIWQKVFSDFSNAPKLIFLSQEEIAMELLKKYHLHSPTFINNLLFSKEYRLLALTYFNGIQCAFNLKEKTGTFFFWGIQKSTSQRMQLFIHNNSLVSKDGSFSLEITPESIQAGLENGKLVPSVLLTFLILAFYYGFFLGGGLRQPMYLSQIKQGYKALLKDVGENTESEYVDSIASDDSVWPRAGLVFLQDGQHNRVPATGLDLLLYKNDDGWRNVVEATKHISYQELFPYVYPELYTDFCKHEDKKQELLDLSQNDIEKITGLDKKIPSWITLEASS